MGEEGRFPGDRDPRSLDSRDASAPLDPALLRTFKMLLPLSGRPSHFSNGAGQDRIDRQGQSNLTSPTLQRPGSNGNIYTDRAMEDAPQQQDVLYPVMLSASLDLPSAEVLSQLLDIFAHRFLPHTPFISVLHRNSSSEFQREKTPPFLVFAMAVLGALFSDDRNMTSWGPSLWQAAAHIHSASCEIDNRIARKVDWVTSVCMDPSFLVNYI